MPPPEPPEYLRRPRPRVVNRSDPKAMRAIAAHIVRRRFSDGAPMMPGLDIKALIDYIDDLEKEISDLWWELNPDQMGR